MNNSKATIYDFHKVGIFNQEETNLPVAVYILTKGNTKLSARLYVCNAPGEFDMDNSFAMTINDEPMILGTCSLNETTMDMILDWMFLNWDHLMAIWFNRDSFDEWDAIVDGFAKF